MPHQPSSKKVEIISTGDYSLEKIQTKNEWMVDNSDILVGVWDGSNGEIGNCIKYAFEYKKPIYRINPINNFEIELVNFEEYLEL